MSRTQFKELYDKLNLGEKHDEEHNHGGEHDGHEDHKRKKRRRREVGSTLDKVYFIVYHLKAVLH